VMVLQYDGRYFHLDAHNAWLLRERNKDRIPPEMHSALREMGRDLAEMLRVGKLPDSELFDPDWGLISD